MTLPLIEELVPAPDPWDVARRLAHLPHLLFLDSAEFHPELGRYSYVTADPVDILIRPASADASGDVFWDDRFDCARIDRPAIPELPPFIGGWAGLFGYHLGRAFERQPPPRRDEFQVPDMAVGVYDWVVSFDHLTGRAWLVSTGIRPEDALLGDRSVWADVRLRAVRAFLANEPASWYDQFLVRRPFTPSVGRIAPADQHSLAGLPGITSNFSREGYQA